MNEAFDPSTGEIFGDNERTASWFAERVDEMLDQSTECSFEAAELVRVAVDVEGLFQDDLAKARNWPPAKISMLRTLALSEHMALCRGKDIGLPSCYTVLYELARATPEEVEAALRDGIITREMTRSQARAIHRRDEQPPEPVITPGFPDGPFRTIVIDPPWPVTKILFERRPVERAAMDYPTWSLERIRDELPIARLADVRGAHVYLWVTHRFLPDGLALFEHWGVRYECLLTWYKPTAMPLWWMFNTEHVLFGKVESLAPLVKGTPTGFTAPQQRHSHKPDEFYHLVRKVSPEPRLTMFDFEREGFERWGVEHANAG